LRESKHRWGIQQRDEYRRQINQTIKALTRNPKMGIERLRWGENVRSFVVGTHIIIYVVVENGIEIARFLHQREDIERALGIRDEKSFED
jgi:plasmid stabilization system protein ParE